MWCLLGRVSSLHQRIDLWALCRYVLMRMVANAGQSLRILWRATLRFSELNALVASARRMASLSSESRHLLAACTAASMPSNCLPQS